MGGEDGIIYELMYLNDRQGIAKRLGIGEKTPSCWKVARNTSNPWHGWMPSIEKYLSHAINGDEGGLIDLAIDDADNESFLYSLSSKDVVDCYDITNEKWEKREDLGRSFKDRGIVSIHAMDSTVTVDPGYIVVASNGDRIFFSRNTRNENNFNHQSSGGEFQHRAVVTSFVSNQAFITSWAHKVDELASDVISSTVRITNPNNDEVLEVQNYKIFSFFSCTS